MPYELYLRHYNRAGVQKNAVIQPLRARFTESVSGQEPLVFALDVRHPQVADIEELDLLVVMLRNQELGLTDFTPAFVAIQRDKQRVTDEDGVELLEFTAPNEKHILSWRHVLWYAGVSDRSDFQNVAAETIMKTVVGYNLTALAAHIPADPSTRQRDGDLAAAMGYDITIEADGAGGNTLSMGFAGANVLSVLQKIAERAGGDFSLRWQGANDWLFAWHPGQLGEDKSTGTDRVLFSTSNNTLAEPVLRQSGAKATTAIVGGRDEGTARQISAVDGPDYAANYDFETFVDARNEVTAEGREFRGALRLEELRARGVLTFDVLQTANQFYSPIPVTGRKTYRAGDLVLATYGVERVRKIDSVRVEWQPPSRGDAFNVTVTTREVSSA